MLRAEPKPRRPQPRNVSRQRRSPAPLLAAGLVCALFGSRLVLPAAAYIDYEALRGLEYGCDWVTYMCSAPIPTVTVVPGDRCQRERIEVTIEATVDGLPDGSILPYIELSGLREVGARAINDAEMTIRADIAAGDTVSLSSRFPVDYTWGTSEQFAARVTRVRRVQPTPWEEGPPSGPPPDACWSCRAGAVAPSSDFMGIRLPISLGVSTNGVGAGDLILEATAPAASNVTPAALRYRGDASQVDLVWTGDFIRQIRSPEILADITTNDCSFDVSLYAGTNITGQSSPYTGLQWFACWHIESVGGETNLNAIRITESRRSGTTNLTARLTTYEWLGGDTNQFVTTFGTGSVQRVVTQARTNLDSSTWTVTRTVNGNPGNTPAYKERCSYLYEEALHSEVLTERIVDPDNLSLTDRWVYASSSSGSGLCTQWISRTGYWEAYAHDANNRLSTIIMQYCGTLPSAEPADSRVVTIGFAPPTTSGDYAISTAETRCGVPTAASETAWSGDHTLRQDTLFLDSAASSMNALVETTQFDSEGRIAWVRYADGTALINDYQTNETNGFLCSLSQFRGTPSNTSGQPVAETGTISRSDFDVLGRITNVTIRAYPQTNIVISGWTVLQSDDLGRPTEIVYNDGTSELLSYGCCGLTSKTDRRGLVTAVDYDGFDRPNALTAPQDGPTLEYDLDAAGRVLSVVLKPPTANGAVPPITNALYRYDLAGRMTQAVDAVGNATALAETVGDGLVVRTATFADGGTAILRTYADGLPHSLTGTAVHAVSYTNGAAAVGTWTRAARIGAGGASSEWEEIWADFAGRPYRILYPDGTSVSNAFNARGQVALSRGRDGLTTLYDRDILGWTVVQALDLNANGTIDASGTDRIARISRTFETRDGIPCLRTTSTIWSDAGPVTNRIVDQALDRDATWSEDWGLISHLGASLPNPASGSAIQEVTNRAPDGTYAILVSTNGRPCQVTRFDSAASRIGRAEYGYDAFGRLVSVADDGSGVATNGYDLAGRTVATTVGVGSGLDQITRYSYDARGRVVGVQLPDGGVVSNEYHLTGELKKTLGARTYPVAFDYDPQGRLSTMTTWRAVGQDATKAVTRWRYDPATGWLSGREMPDGATFGYAYSGTRLAFRTSACETVTSYSYTPAGEVAGVSYPAGAGLSCSNVYDRLGRQVSAADAAVTRSNVYTSFGALAEEICSGTHGESRVAWSYDSVHRLAAIAASNASAVLASAAYGYDSAGRLATVSDGALSFSYAYCPSNDLVASVTATSSAGPVLAALRGYDALNRLAGVTNRVLGAVSSIWAYAYNQADQRTRAALADGSYWTNAYDSLGQVIGGRKMTAGHAPLGGAQFGYAFDDIGNRTSATNDGHVAAYTANVRNQYTQRTIPGVVGVMGEAPTNAAVLVNGLPADRVGTHFHKLVEADNSSAAAYPELITLAGIAGGSAGPDLATWQTGRQFLARTPEAFVHDANGNLLSDGRWTNTWDAEDRLISMETLTNLPAAVPRVRLEFAYDAASRRVRKIVSVWSNEQWTAVSDRHFLWAGWNLVAEYGTQSGAGVTNSYLWGADLLGGLDSAGGVGGLLAVTRQATGDTSLPIFNGNGDVMGLVDAQSGASVAQYEFGPFGESLRATGPRAAANPFRFSTKYEDIESRLLYYGLRYYAPPTGRWLSEDPIGIEGGLNLYVMCLNDLVDLRDPFGLTNDLGDFGWIYTTQLPRVERQSVTASRDDCCFQNRRDSGRRQYGDNGFIQEWDRSLSRIDACAGQYDQRSAVGRFMAEKAAQENAIALLGPAAAGIPIGQSIAAWTDPNASDSERALKTVAAGIALLGFRSMSAAAKSTPELTKVTSWASEGITPDLNPGRWVQLGDATKPNFWKTGLPGPKATFQGEAPFLKIEGSTVPFENSITAPVPTSSLQWPQGWEWWKGILGQRQIKP